MSAGVDSLNVAAASAVVFYAVGTSSSPSGQA
jgi:tRNA G18 (ribose-2'-O)-methylase SpoU